MLYTCANIQSNSTVLVTHFLGNSILIQWWVAHKQEISEYSEKAKNVICANKRKLRVTQQAGWVTYWRNTDCLGLVLTYLHSHQWSYTVGHKLSSVSCFNFCVWVAFWFCFSVLGFPFFLFLFFHKRDYKNKTSSEKREKNKGTVDCWWEGRASTVLPRLANLYGQVIQKKPLSRQCLQVMNCLWNSLPQEV